MHSIGTAWFFTVSDFTSISSHIHNWVLFYFGSISSFFLELLLLREEAYSGNAE